MPLKDVIQQLQASARTSGHRHLLALSSARPPALRQALADALPPADDLLWLSSADAPPLGHRHLHPKRADEALGTEIQHLIVDLTHPSSLEALGSVAGALKAGGLMVLITPPLAEWTSLSDPFEPPQTSRLPDAPPYGRAFLQRFITTLRASPGVTCLNWDTGERTPFSPDSLPLKREELSPPIPDEFGALTLDQHRAIEAVLKVARGRRRRPLVLTADRGRGKSAALGLAAAQVLRKGPIHIEVVAPRPAAVAPLFDACRRALGLSGQRWAIHHQGSSLKYRAPTAISNSPSPVDLLLVDEAAALPVPLLRSLLKANGRVVFSTTLHGYEGTGQGFNIRFRGILDREAKGWRACHLTMPIRWAEGDPLEAFIDAALLLDAQASALPEGLSGPPTLRLHSAQGLLQDEPRLRAIVGLLIDAHYRTTPSDTHRLLDSPGVLTLSLEIQGEVVGALVALPEGPIPDELAKEIYRGRRRLRGQLLPQTLITHLGIKESAQLKGVRIQRIAIHPQMQGRGLGSYLLREFGAHVGALGFDYMGTSFGATAPLLRFWERGGLWPCRVGITRSKSSGLNSAILLRPLSPKAEKTLNRGREAFRDTLLHLLGRALWELDKNIALALLLQVGEARGLPTPPIREKDLEPLAAFAWGPRDGAMIPGPLRRLAEIALTNAEGQGLLGLEGSTYLLRTGLQGQDWTRIARDEGIHSTPGGKKALADAIKPLLLAWGGENFLKIIAEFEGEGA